jgi:HK97 family phage prohead protease
MSLNQFEKWLREQGVDRKNGRYYVPCAAGATRGESDSALRVTMATRRKDRHGDILEPSGADTSAFLQNPVVLWAHQYDELPIGRVAHVWSDEDALVAEIVFDSRPFAQEVLRLYREGFLSGWSVGFLPKKWQVIEDAAGKFDGYHIIEWELIELSAVPVPANPEALTRELQSGAVQPPALAKALTQLLNPSDMSDKSDLSDVSDSKSVHAPEIAPDALADALFPRLREKLREWAEAAASREIRRKQGRLD